MDFVKEEGCWLIERLWVRGEDAWFVPKETAA